MLNGETEIFDDSNHIYAPALLLARLLRRSGSESVKNSTNFAGVQVRTSAGVSWWPSCSILAAVNKAISRGAIRHTLWKDETRPD